MFSSRRIISSNSFRISSFVAKNGPVSLVSLPLKSSSIRSVSTRSSLLLKSIQESGVKVSAFGRISARQNIKSRPNAILVAVPNASLTSLLNAHPGAQALETTLEDCEEEDGSMITVTSYDDSGG